MKNKLLLFAMGIALSAQTLMAQVPSYVPTDGLVGYWPFNGNANDISGNGNNGIVNQLTWGNDRFGNPSSTAEFNGDYNRAIRVQNPNATFGGEFSYSFWLKINSPLSYYNTIINALGYCQLYGPYPSYINAGLVGKLGFSGYLGYNNSNNTIDDGNWHHGVMVVNWTGGIVKIYIDGVLNATSTFAPQVVEQPPVFDFGQNYGIINDPVQGPQNIFAGELDDIGIWNRALTQQEITTMYNSIEVPTYSDTCNNVSGSLTQGLVGYWPFCGNANDDSGHDNNGTVNGATLTTDRFGNTNSAYSFNGTNNYIEIGNSSEIDTMNDFTISTWYSTNTISPQFQHLVSKDFIGASPTGDWDLFLNYGKVKFDITLNNNNNFGLSNSNISENTWYNIVITRNSTSGEIKTYINGIVDNTFIGYSGIYSNNQSLNFGRQGSSNQHFLNGKLDDIGIWNRVLSQAEVTQLYNQNQCFNNTTITDTLIINVGQLSYNNPITYANNITMAPNPASTQININFNNITDLNGGSLKVINSLGQEVATTPITTSGTQSIMQLATWGGSGMYYVQIINPQGIVVDVKKIVLQ